MRKHVTRLAVLALALLVPLMPASAVGQEDRSPNTRGEAASPSALPGIFGEVLDVRVINLEVVVTDKEGTQIRGLTSDDFQMMIDGEEVSIDYFSEVRGGVAVEPVPATGVAGEASSLPAVGSVTPGEPVGTSFLVFIDDYFGLPTDRNAVLESLKAELPFLKPEDRMAIVSYDGDDLEMLSTWSSLQRPLERAIDEAMGRPTKGLQRLVERQRYDLLNFREIFGIEELDAQEPAGGFDTDLDPEERFYIEMVTEQLNRSIAAASATLRSFAKPPGRKVMILLSGGWPFVPAEFLLSDTSRILFDRGGPYGNNLYRRLVETANVLGYTIYPVDLPGLDRDVVDVTRGESSNRTRPQDLAGGSSFRREDEAHTTLRYLARETGGEALINANRLGALKRVATDVGSYYWLGFTPVRARDDVSHEVEVKLRNPDFRARARRSFLDSSRDREVSMAVESTLLFGSAAAAGSVRVAVGDPVEVPKRRMAVEIMVAVALDDVTILSVGERYVAELDLRFAVQDDAGQQAPIPVIPLRLSFTEPPDPGTVGTYKTRLLLRRKPHKAVAAVHDPASGRIFSTGFEILPGDR